MKKADCIFDSMHNVIESDVVDDYNKIRNETIHLLTVKVPVKVTDAACIMKYDNMFRTEIPYFTITIQNPLDEPVYVSNLVVSAINEKGEDAHYSYPYEYYEHKDLSLDIPAKSNVVYKWNASVFLHGIKYYLLGIDDFYMKNSKKNFKEIEKYTGVEEFKVEAKY